jgi:phage-related minor tail protein
LLNKLTDAALKNEEESANGEIEQKKIEFHKKYGQQLIDLTAKIAEDEAKYKYAIAAKGLDEISQLEKKKKMEDALAAQELERKIAANPQIAGRLRAAADAENKRKKAELDLQQGNITRDELLNYTKKADAEQNSIEMERQRLDIYKQNLLASDADLQIALSRLKTEQQIAEIENNKKLEADPKGRASEIARLEQIQKAREAVINQAADLKMLQDMNQSVFNNMGNAIDNFVRNGKLSFKDLTRSIIQDLISIAMKAQMMSMFKGFSFFNSGDTGAISYADGTSSGMTASQYFQQRANGGPVNGGSPYLVGEQGPELFVPQGSGTILPNKMTNAAMTNNQPQVVYNGPYIANMSAIDTQSGIQFLAKNKSTIWAVNQSAQRSLPASR